MGSCLVLLVGDKANRPLAALSNRGIREENTLRWINLEKGEHHRILRGQSLKMGATKKKEHLKEKG